VSLFLGVFLGCTVLLTRFLGYTAAVSGGETFFYPNFHAPRDLLKLSQELAHTVTRETGYQALMKVRCSNGLQVSSYHGNFLQNTFGADLEIGTIDADKALGVIFSYDGKLDTKLDAHFQAALLYTSANGQRRVRCINIVAAVNDGGMETMKFIDQDAVVSIIAKEGERSLSFQVARYSYKFQRRRKPATNPLKISVPTSPKRPLISSLGTERIFRARILQANSYYPRISKSSPCICWPCLSQEPLRVRFT
jgi:hypothetical protein